MGFNYLTEGAADEAKWQLLPSSAMHEFAEAMRHSVLNGNAGLKSLSPESIYHAITAIRDDAIAEAIISRCRSEGAAALIDPLPDGVLSFHSMITPSCNYTKLSYARAVNKSFMYIVRAGDSPHIKIGRSRIPVERLERLRTTSPWQLDLLLLVDEDEVTEARAHAKFDGQRTNGEWFEWCREMQDFIDLYTDVARWPLPADCDGIDSERSIADGGSSGSKGFPDDRGGGPGAAVQQCDGTRAERADQDASRESP